MVAANQLSYGSTCRGGRWKLHLSTLHRCTDSIAAWRTGAILAAAGGGEGVSRRPRPLLRRRGLRYLVLAVVLLTPLPNRARPDVVRLPFRTMRSLIVVQGKINGIPVSFLLDTGAECTIIGARIYGNVPYRLRSVERNSQGPGIVGDSVALRVNLQLANHRWMDQRVAVMNLDALCRLLGIQFDGLLGQDVLREFRSVRIDYRTHVIELED